jgi:hypothetical protein
MEICTFKLFPNFATWISHLGGEGNLHFQIIPELCHVDKITGQLKSRYLTGTKTRKTTINKNTIKIINNIH